MPGIADAAKRITGTKCPEFKFDPSLAKKSARKHDTLKREALALLESIAMSRGWRVLGSAGVTTPEPSVNLNIHGQRLRGRIDVLLAAMTSYGLAFFIGEVKSSYLTALSYDTTVQAALYSFPLIECKKLKRKCVTASGNAIRISSTSGSIHALIDGSVPKGEYIINNVEIYVIGRDANGRVRVNNVTDYVLEMYDTIASLGIANKTPIPSGVRIPGPYCLVCEHYRSKRCRIRGG